MKRSVVKLLPFHIATLDVWFWIWVLVIAAICWQLPILILLILLLVWRAGELWILWQMLPQPAGSAD